MRGIRIRDDAQSIQPGEFRDVDAPGGNLKDSFMMLPFKEPSAYIIKLNGYRSSSRSKICINC